MRKLPLLLTLLLALTSLKISASHMMGVDITYTHIAKNKYKVILTFYRDCAGIPPPTSPTINIHNTCKNYDLTLSLSKIVANCDSKVDSVTDMSPLCHASVKSSTCYGGKLPGLQRCVYTGIIDLGDTCKDWIFSYTDCCRNAAITNIKSPSSTSLYVESHLNNTHTSFYGNNSAVFEDVPVIYITDKDTSTLNYSAYDVDGDSLAYSLVVPKNTDSKSFVVYDTGLSYLRPFKDTFSSFDSTTGLYRVSPIGVQITVAAVVVKEYRKGKFIGSVERDVEIIVSHSNNHLPVISNFGGALCMNINMCAKDTLQLKLITNDMDSGQRLKVSIDSIKNLKHSVDTFAHPHIYLTFVPDTSQINPLPVLVYIHIKDGNCPIMGINTYIIKIYINSCSSNVWPGDCNSDLHCNMYDVLSFGLAFGDTGGARTGATNSWTAQSCVNWIDTFVNGVNHKHADCNGDGIVDLNDTTALILNYGDSHPLRETRPNRSAPALYVKTGGTLAPGNSFTYPIIAGTSLNPCDSIYGLAFRLFYDSTVINSSSVSITLDSCWIGSKNKDIVTINHFNRAKGFIDMAFSGIDHKNRSGYGPVAYLHGTIKGSLPSDSALFSFAGAKCIDVNENKRLISSKNMLVYIINTGTKEINSLMGDIKLAPTLVNNGYFNFSNFTFHKITSITVYDGVGRVVKYENELADDRTINVSTLPAGAYFVSFSLDNGYRLVKRLIVQK